MVGVAVAGHFAYVADDFLGFYIYDVSDPRNPVRLFNTNSVLPNDVVVEGRYAYLSVRLDTLAIFDVNNPTNAVQVGSLSDNRTAYQLMVSNGRAYLALGTGFVIASVTDPTAPTLLDSEATQGDCIELAAAGDYFYMADAILGLAVYDQTNSRCPVLIDRAGDGFRAMGVVTAGQLLYLADEGGGLQIYSLTNPAAPNKLGQAAGYAETVTVAGNYAYVGEGNAMAVYDVSNPSHPTEVAETQATNFMYELPIAVGGDYIYAPCGQHGLQIYRMIPQLQMATDPANNLTLTWPATDAKFTLEQTPDLTLTNWTVVTNAPSHQRLQNEVTLTRTRASFFRLRSP